jgi:hypothetical protein
LKGVAVLVAAVFVQKTVLPASKTAREQQQQQQRGWESERVVVLIRLFATIAGCRPGPQVLAKSIGRALTLQPSHHVLALWVQYYRE